MNEETQAAVNDTRFGKPDQKQPLVCVCATGSYAFRVNHPFFVSDFKNKDEAHPWNTQKRMVVDDTYWANIKAMNNKRYTRPRSLLSVCAAVCVCVE